MRTQLKLVLGAIVLASIVSVASEIKAIPQVEDQFVNPIGDAHAIFTDFRLEPF